MKKKTLISMLMTFCILISASQPAMAAKVDVTTALANAKNSSAYYIDSEGKRCYFTLDITPSGQIIVEDSISKAVFDTKSQKLTTEVFETGEVHVLQVPSPYTDVSQGLFPPITVSDPSQTLSATSSYPYYATVKFKPTTDSSGTTHQDSLKIYAKNLGTQVEQTYHLYSPARTTAAAVITLVASYLTGITIGAALSAAAIKGAAAAVINELASATSGLIVNGILQMTLSVTLEATETLYKVQAIDPKSNRISSVYNGGKYVITQSGKYWSKTYYTGYYPEFVQNRNTDIRFDHAVAYWIFSDFWSYIFNGIQA